MKKEGLIRGTMLMAGFIAMVAILCSQPFYQSTEQAKAKTETRDDSRAETVLQAPADAIPGHSVQVDDSSVYQLIATFFESAEKTDLPHVVAKETGRLLEALFGTIIAPNAP